MYATKITAAAMAVLAACIVLIAVSQQRDQVACSKPSARSVEDLFAPCLERQRLSELRR